MTTGSTGYPITDANSYNVRTWNGVNGKYEVVNGRRRIKFNAYTMSATSHFASPTYYDYKINPSGWKEQFWPSASLGSLGWSLNDTVKAQAKLVSKLKTTTLNLGKNVAEGRQFITMVRKTLFTVAKAVASLKKVSAEELDPIRILMDAHRDKGGRLNYEIIAMLKRHRFSATDVAGKWLELQYGWLPLLSDVHAAAALFEAQMESERISVVKSSSSRTVHFNASTSPSNYSVYGLVNFITKIKYEFAEDEAISLQRKLGLEDPASIIWEVVPYSFVVDWFMPIGSYLESLHVLPKLKGRWCMTKVLSWNAHKPQQIRFDPTLKYDLTKFALQHTSIDVSRTVGTGFLFQNIAPPDIKPLSEVFSPMHIYNAVALATQLISSGTSSRR